MDGNRGQEVVMLCGVPASGKSSVAQRYVDQGYVRLNRDTIGGRTERLIPLMIKALDDGAPGVILDNTHATANAREKFITALNGRCPIHAIWFDVTTADCQFNACRRMIQREGRLLTPDEMAKHDSPNIFPPHVIFRFAKQFEKPTKKEGFATVTAHKHDHWGEGDRFYPKPYMGKALILDYDGTLRTSSGPFEWPTRINEIEILPGRARVLKAWQDAGYRLLGVSNQSPISNGQFTEAEAREMFNYTNELLGLDIEVEFCPHRPAPISCYCRKPGPGWGVHFIEKYKLDPGRCYFVGDSTSDKTFAHRCGFKFQYPDTFFDGESGILGVAQAFEKDRARNVDPLRPD